MLVLNKIVTMDYDVRSYQDQRRRVDRVTAEYRDEKGYSYRKSFEAPRGRMPNVPDRGTHAELNALKFQLGA